MKRKLLVFAGIAATAVALPEDLSSPEHKAAEDASNPI